MSYGVKYRITFQDDYPNNSDIWENINVNWEDYTGLFASNFAWQVDLLLNGYSGSITSLTTLGKKVGGKPLLIKGDSTDDDPLYPILPVKADVELVSESLFEFDELFSGDERNCQVKIYKGGELEYTMYVNPHGSIDLYKDFPYKIKVKCEDGLNQLKAITYDDSGTAYSGTQSFLEIILNCLNKIEYEINLYTAVNKWEQDMDASADPLGQMWIDADTWVRNGETMSCYDVLSNIAYRCNAVVFQAEGKWHFIRILQWYQEVDNILRTLALEPILTLSGEPLTILGVDSESLTGYTRYEYDYLGTLLVTENYKPNITAGSGEGYNLRALNRDTIVMIRQPWKKATIVYDHEEIPNIVIDGGFEPANFTNAPTYTLLANWLITGTIAFEGVFQTDVPDSTMGLQITTELGTEDVYEANYLLNSSTFLEWKSGDQVVIKLKVKFTDVSSNAVKWYYTLRLTDYETSSVYYHNGSTWSTSPDFSATVQADVVNAQTDYQEDFSLPTTFTRGNIQMQLHGLYDGINLNPKVTIDNLTMVHYNPTEQVSDKGTSADTFTTIATSPSIVSEVGEFEVVIGEGRTSNTKGAIFMNSLGSILPGTWYRGGREEESKTLDEVNLQSAMNIRYLGSKILEGSYKGYTKYGDVVIHDALDNRYFMVKRFEFDAKMRKVFVSLHEIKDIDTVELTYQEIIE